MRLFRARVSRARSFYNCARLVRLLIDGADLCGSATNNTSQGDEMCEEELR